MVKTTVYLGEQVVQRLRSLARVRGRSQAELIREALERFVEGESQSFERPAPVGVGGFRSGRPDIARQAEKLLRQAARSRKLAK
jgi:Arc/MetJ-type ribon-helix-helix transcriptional regulator